jgi:DNA processing protein
MRRMLPADGSRDSALFDATPSSLKEEAARMMDDAVPELLTHVEQNGWRWLVPGDDDYPGLLHHVSDPPLGLFVRGELGDGPYVAVVGSRRATAYGRQVSRVLAEELARAGVVVVSGMARGVDASAHEGAVAGGGSTWAVWGTGPDRIYPPEHDGLATSIASHGALITEYPPGTPPRRQNFPERNRLLAGLSNAVVVVEAAARSGALITARLALDEGREVLAVPGSILSKLSVGPNTLLRLGARPLLTPSDVFEVIGHQPPDTGSENVEPHPLLRHLPAGESVTADELVRRSGLEVTEVHAALLELELGGVVERLPDGRYQQRRPDLPRS